MALTTEDILLYKNLKGLGNVTAFKLCDYALLNNINLNSNEDFLNFYNLAKDKKIARAMKDYSMNDIMEAKELAEEIIENSKLMDINVISYYDNLFPENLKKFTNNGKEAQPLILYYKGDIKNALNRKAVTIIGTREITSEGIISGEYISKKMADNDFNIVSGLAVGCDTVAHKGALKSNNGMTTAFLAHGLDIIYPKENTKLASEIVERNGVLISEYPIGTGVRGNYLVERDRLQAGMSDATIVIQTGIKGGTMHAVNTTLENNKPLYAINYKDKELLNHEKIQGNLMLFKKNEAIPLTSSNLNDIIISIKNTDIVANSNKNSFDLFDNVEDQNSNDIKCVIFDLDQTLVDTSKLESLRNNRQWKDIPNRLNECFLYDDMKIVFNKIINKGIKIAIVTSSPGIYAKQILEYFDLKYDLLVAYHDVKNKKPHAEPMLKVINELNILPENIISFGDRDIDIISSNNANIKSVACTWGAKDINSLKASNPNILIYKPNEILNTI